MKLPGNSRPKSHMKLFLKIQIGGEGYLLDATQIVRILPLTVIKRIPHVPAAIAGCFDYQGTVIPLVDLTELMLGRPAPRHLSTRVILVPFGPGKGSSGRRDNLLGLMAEKATETIRTDSSQFTAAGVTPDAAPYLGPVRSVGGRMLQQLDLARLLPDDLSAMLFRGADRGADPC
jgi:chemotaxis-related protein WspB